MLFKRNISASVLKWIAIIAMFIDHLGIMLYRHELSTVVVYYIMRGVGRLAFPIFCFLLVEGFCNTKSFWKYFIRVAVFALLSEIPFELFIHGRLYGFGSNILFNFTLSLLLLWLINKLEGKGAMGRFGGIVLAVLAAGLSKYLEFDYTWKCISMVAALYLLRRNFLLRNLAVICILVLDTTNIGLCALFSLFLISGYNGEQGKFPKWLGYVFYPAHLMGLWLFSVYF